MIEGKLYCSYCGTPLIAEKFVSAEFDRFTGERPIVTKYTCPNYYKGFFRGSFMHDSNLDWAGREDEA